MLKSRTNIALMENTGGDSFITNIDIELEHGFHTKIL